MSSMTFEEARSAKFADQTYLEDTLRYFSEFFIQDFRSFVPVDEKGENRIVSVTPPLIQCCLYIQHQETVVPVKLRVFFSVAGCEITDITYLRKKETESSFQQSHLTPLSLSWPTMVYESFESLLDNVGGKAHRNHVLQLICQKLQENS
ncbi:hypothetical protein HMI54_015506 [Coelomomyces lativittatus]|nr:hypothetical protein HMI55_001707 [Coelomomyces lativittatus]KAJ1507459.1 hypothetical protein HMI56_000089 [Coelomomyces lativittatus]KAJ1512746.1 hypothetical protein HMI54_015506 [Coelomomyces lativittatus]